MNSQLRQRAISLRMKNQLSYSEIKRRLKVSKSTLSYWLREFPLNHKKVLELQRNGWKKGEAGREKFRISMRKKREEKILNAYNKQKKKFIKISEKMLFAAGLILYASEGDKKNNSRLVVANTDPLIIKFFIYWAKHFLKISSKEIRIQLHLYENMDIEAEKKFWSNNLRVNSEQFYRPTIRKLKKSSFSYKESNRHGTCSVYILGVDRKLEVMTGIKAFLDKIDKDYLKGM